MNNDFSSAAAHFAEVHLNCSYSYSLAMDNLSGDDPLERRYVVTFSKPTPIHPAPLAVAKVIVRVVSTGGQHVVISYSVEGRKQQFDPNTEFEERWLDEVIERKMKMRGIIDLSDEFTESRLT
uniref:Uncharacterized protein n=1 Tax=Fibrocapsa japonica TaxID=94617 RepID=A0A7S2Y1G3_9STRA|mmetsp:Transcript_2174/g.3210  ORF Transcript_2174/g.3210 Transcript_2174/m.3210 type:complete len:123 (+) Transcript_2174:193-561(+)|eukprot:CAMPEP_0113934122 /NCGR_PEP_ID=MMETSP1339-20121228/1454_1 /TAXON_ID=94617 /ORGANISM="Fibrocapsa japonica" /LENGTH=122 /DNA_ID=CAMNT_0000935779 /DNA_START=173 /DNA_END=541 /DNA_ORIENTATION=+ /assembly_acc=CAM_ASM_000762